MKIEIKLEGEDLRVKLDLSWNEAQAIKKLARLGIVHKEGNFINAEEADAGQKIVRVLDKITKVR